MQQRAISSSSLVSAVLVAIVATGVAQFQTPWNGGSQTPQQPGMPVMGADTSFTTIYNGKPPRVYMSIDMLPLDKTMHNPKLVWVETQSTPVYCISEAPTANLVFSCLDCNNTEIDQRMISLTVDKSSIAGYPAARLDSLSINGTWHNKRLACTAYYQGPDGPMNVTVVSVLDVQFLAEPVVVTDKFHMALAGHRLFQRFPVMLHCKVLGNPPPSMVSWYINGEKVSDGGSISIGQQHRGKGVQCEVTSATSDRTKTSRAVQIEELIQPQLVGHNFREVKASSVFEPNSNRLSLDHHGQRVQLLCRAKGYPQPQIFWYHRLPESQKVINASCEEGITLPKDYSHAEMGEVSSSCSLVFDSYYKSGTYWCVACSAKAVGDWAFSSSLSPNDGLEVQVTGPPVLYEEAVLEQLPNSHDVQVRMYFCAEPPPEEVYWMINGERLNIKDKMGNFEAEQPIKNTTFPSCYTAPLIIRPLTDDDKQKNVQFHVKNILNQVNKGVNLVALAGNGQTHKYSANDIGLAVGLSLAVIAIVICLCVVFCWMRRIACFRDDKIARQQKAAPKTQKKYPINIIPEIARSAPQKERSPIAVASPPNDFYKPPEPAYPPLYTTTQPQLREGLNYAELDLVKDAANRRPIVSNIPVQYSTLQSSGRPATTSIV